MQILLFFTLWTLSGWYDFMFLQNVFTSITVLRLNFRLVEPNLISAHNNITQWMNRVENLPGVKEYLQSRPESIGVGVFSNALEQVLRQALVQRDSSMLCYTIGVFIVKIVQCARSACTRLRDQISSLFSECCKAKWSKI